MTPRDTPGDTPAVAHVEAQGKLNLILRILGREPNGYHRLETLFQRIALADTVRVRVSPAGRTLDCAGTGVGPVERNLAWRAALAFAAQVGWPSGFAIEIEKRIPVGGGLGGGSADAAAVLRALNALAPQPLAAGTLAAIALTLGADVPYLLSEHATAIGMGLGERLTPVAPLPARPVALIVQAFGVSSAAAFGWYAARAAAGPPERTPVPLSSPLPWDIIAKLASNSLEAPVFAHHPQIAAARDALEQSGATIARMSGSGATVFGVFDAPPGGVAAGLPRGILTGPGTLVATATAERVSPVQLLHE